MVEINFLCAHKKLRSKRVAPSLISEITRRVNREGIFQACYTAGAVIPRPVNSCQYFHRSLNPGKLLDIRFSGLKAREKRKDHIKKYTLPSEPTVPGLKPMEMKHTEQVKVMLNDYLARFDLAPVFSVEEVQHWLLTREDVVYSFVVEDDEGNVTDFLSFYNLPSTVMKHPEHNHLKAAYSYYNVATKHDLTELMRSALILAKERGFDVYNALQLMDNGSVFEALQFGPGDGKLNYYLYNYRLKAESSIGLVLL